MRVLPLLVFSMVVIVCGAEGPADKSVSKAAVARPEQDLEGSETVGIGFFAGGSPLYSSYGGYYGYPSGYYGYPSGSYGYPYGRFYGYPSWGVRSYPAIPVWG